MTTSLTGKNPDKWNIQSAYEIVERKDPALDWHRPLHALKNLLEEAIKAGSKAHVKQASRDHYDSLAKVFCDFQLSKRAAIR